jgi:molecular chaperone GrpE
MDKKKKENIEPEVPAAEAEAAKIDESAAQLEALTKELAETKDLYLRTAAEYENYRRRSAREREALYGDAMAAAITGILPVLDNLERAAAVETADEAYQKGVDMTLRQFNDCLAKLGVKEIPALGEEFNPTTMNAVMHVEMENCDENTVVEVFQKGFMMGERVVRHATVKVAN